MTKFFILPMLLLATISSHAQYRRTQMQMPVADKTKEIPMKPIVVEGELAGVPDGTPVQFAFRVKRTRAWDTANNTLVDTLRNGKFHIEKKFIYKDFDENDDNMEYMINVEGKALFVYAYPGAKVKVTGNPSTRQDVITWKAESDHPLQKEFYEYRAYEQEKLAPIRKKIQEAYEADDVDEALVQKLGRQRDSINVVSMLDFMKNKECNSVFAMYLSSISNKAMRLGNKQLKDRILNLFLTKVPVDYDDQNAVEAKGFLSSGEQLKIGAQSKDFTLYDRKGKEHRISEFKGKYTILEFTSSNVRHAIADSNACKSPTFIECFFSDSCHAVRNSDACSKIITICECTVSNACHTVRDFYACKPRAAPECTFSNAYHTVTNSDASKPSICKSFYIKNLHIKW